MAAWCDVERIWVQMKTQQESFRTFSGETKIDFCTTTRTIKKIKPGGAQLLRIKRRILYWWLIMGQGL